MNIVLHFVYDFQSSFYFNIENVQKITKITAQKKTVWHKVSVHFVKAIKNLYND